MFVKAVAHDAATVTLNSSELHKLAQSCQQAIDEDPWYETATGAFQALTHAAVAVGTLTSAQLEIFHHDLAHLAD